MPFAIEPSTEISHRGDFSLLCDARCYVDAVEVGVDQGIFARQFMSRFGGHWIYLVDPYKPYTHLPNDRTGDLLMASHAMAPYHGRVRFLQLESVEAAKWIRHLISPQFVYLDAGHEQEEVEADLAAWWDVLEPGGMLGGHDWNGTNPGVAKAVRAWARENEHVVRITGDYPASWYVYKGEPEVLMVRMYRSGEEPNPHYAPPSSP